MKVSVIIPSDRETKSLQATLRAIESQITDHEIETIVVGASLPESQVTGVRFIVVEDRNPARRRNLGVEQSTGEILAFTDDDAMPESDWVENALRCLSEDQAIVAVGGPDPAPLDSPAAELISETLLATRWIGSGVACHESRSTRFDLRWPHDIALVNLFVKRSAFLDLGGFDAKIGYIGEDTALVEKLIEVGRVVYEPTAVVRHRRRAFPGPYLKQRFRYRVKTGSMLASGERRWNAKVVSFLVAGLGFVGATAYVPAIGIALATSYVVITTVLGIAHTRLRALWWPVVPVAFAAHHAVYFVGIVTGLIKRPFGG